MVADLAKLSLGREDYYLREIAENREEYLSGHGESPGRWYGAGATALGQDGTASTEAFRRSFEGCHPETGELLGRAHGRNAVPSWDLVLRPVKDMGVLFGLGGERERRAVMSAHHEGIAAAVTYLDAQVGTRRGHGGHQRVSGQGLVVVGFDHRTSRAGDPLPHTHLSCPQKRSVGACAAHPDEYGATMTPILVDQVGRAGDGALNQFLGRRRRHGRAKPPR